MMILSGSRYHARCSSSGSSMMVSAKSREFRPTSSSRSSTMSSMRCAEPPATRSASSSAYSVRRSRAHVRAAPKCACRTCRSAGELAKDRNPGGDISGDICGCALRSCSHQASHSVLRALMPPTSAVRWEWSACRIFGCGMRKRRKARTVQPGDITYVKGNEHGPRRVHGDSPAWTACVLHPYASLASCFPPRCAGNPLSGFQSIPPARGG